MNPNISPVNTDISPLRIVVIHTAFLGDLFLSIPFLNHLKRKYPKSIITLVCKKGIGNFFMEQKIVSEVLEVSKGSRTDYSNVIQLLNEKKQDIVICIHRSFRSYVFALKIKAKLRIGYNLGYNYFGFHKTVQRNLTWPEPIRILQLLTLLDPDFEIFFKSETAKVDFNFKDINLKMAEIPSWARSSKLEISDDLSSNSHIASYFSAAMDSEKRIALFPGSVWNTKRWPVEYYALLAERLVNLNYSVVLLGGPDERVYGEFIQLKVPRTTKLTNLIGQTTVSESASILNQCDLVVANDSASAHLSALLEKKILVFFGPTVLAFGYRPWGSSVYVLENTELSCRPCGAHGPMVCPIKTHVCMKSISAETAFEKIKTIV